MKQKENEDALVARIARALAGTKPSALDCGLGDDAALWRPTPGRQLILTCDWFLEGSHFLRHKHPADAVGWKCLARATSDIAAMGGQPRCFLLSLALPGALAGRWLNQFLSGLKRASQALHCECAGGDTTWENKVLIGVTVIGEVRRARAIRRCGAKPGDLIFVSGTLGEAGLGFRQLRRGRGMARPSNHALRKHLYPEPRLALGAWLAERRLASTMMDISDGLSTDLARLCRASGVGARIESVSLPRTARLPAAEAEGFALHGGEDYELLFTVGPRNAQRLPEKFQGLSLTCIGRITKERKVVMETGQGIQTLQPGGWDPFR